MTHGEFIDPPPFPILSFEHAPVSAAEANSAAGSAAVGIRTVGRSRYGLHPGNFRRMLAGSRGKKAKRAVIYLLQRELNSAIYTCSILTGEDENVQGLPQTPTRKLKESFISPGECWTRIRLPLERADCRRNSTHNLRRGISTNFCLTDFPPNFGLRSPCGSG
jgi:hypothetical protein